MLQSIEMAVSIDITVSQPIEIALGEIFSVTANRDRYRRDVTVF